MKVELKGIVRGVYSGYALEEQPVLTFSGVTVEEVVIGLMLDEWIFVLRVNGKRIKNAFRYLDRKGLPRSDYMRVTA